MRLIVAVEQRVFGDVRPVSIDIFLRNNDLKEFNVHLAGVELRARKFWISEFRALFISKKVILPKTDR
ncbi:hypothetical protein HMPREF0497_0586 [Lentilactobacillus buchneri ATCC 11577]|nr:hypothetical protein HMPREF0497_0586 [Lentilactobacillus buchneri ATCC 11577]MCT3396365.1 hypothetical protein [Lentilactobacillus hilgardii]